MADDGGLSGLSGLTRSAGLRIDDWGAWWNAVTRPGALGEIALIAACGLLAWGLAALLHRAWTRAGGQSRNGRGPALLEMRTYRLRAHWVFEAQLYRDKSEIEEWRKRGPLTTLTTRLKAAGLLSEDDFQALLREADFHALGVNVVKNLRLEGDGTILGDTPVIDVSRNGATPSATDP